MVRIPQVRLNQGVSIPQLGFGVFKIPPEQTTDALLAAFEAGYRHIDTAQVYGNEAEVGEAIVRSGIPRKEIFLTTKLFPEKNGYSSAIEEFDRSLARLRTDYVDLYLVHHPGPDKEHFLDAWQGFEKLKDGGEVRAIGVSNLNVGHLRWLAERTETVPAVNQVEIHPHQQQAALRAYHDDHGIISTAWGALQLGAALDDAVIGGLAARYGKTPAQITLRWHVQVGNVALVKSTSPARMRENADIFDFELSLHDMAAMSRIDRDPDGEQGRIVKFAAPMWRP